MDQFSVLGLQPEHLQAHRRAQGLNGKTPQDGLACPLTVLWNDQNRQVSSFMIFNCSLKNPDRIFIFFTLHTHLWWADVGAHNLQSHIDVRMTVGMSVRGLVQVKQHQAAATRCYLQELSQGRDWLVVNSWAVLLWQWGRGAKGIPLQHREAL